MPKKESEYTVLRDTREKDEHGWIFPKANRCLGTIETGLPTGDYTLQGYEKLFVIERKGSVAEFARNLVQDRFEAELVRMDEFAHPYIILEFELTQIVEFPKGSGIPVEKWKYIKLSPQFLMRSICELQVNHKAKVIFAGKYGKYIASSLFKRITENVQKST